MGAFNVARFLLNAEIEKIARYLNILAELHKHGDEMLSLESLEKLGYPCQILTRMSGWGLLNRHTSSLQGVTYSVNHKEIEAYLSHCHHMLAFLERFKKV